jgi:aspartate-semialdehyde dehydrogenase
MADPTFEVGVVGATGLAGRDLLRLLEERGFPAGTPRLFGSPRTAGGGLEDEEGRAHGTIELLRPGCFAGLDLVFFTAGPAIAETHVPDAVGCGALVVDTSSYFRFQQGVPLVVPEVNAADLAIVGSQGVVACPSAVTTALAVVLAPLVAAFPVRRVVASTYQGAAGAGTRALHHLVRDSVALLSGRGDRGDRPSSAFDCVPLVGGQMASGASGYEVRLRAELQKVLGDALPPLAVTAVRVPSFIGSGVVLAIESDGPMPAARVAEVLRPAPGILLHGTEDQAVVTLRGIAGSSATHVGRLRDDPSVPHGVLCWVAIDAVVKGRALNAVQIGELLVRHRH